MPTIEFRFAARSIRVVIPPDGARRTILDVAKAVGAPLLFNCETGDCGACVVRVEASGAAAPLSDQETFFLMATGRGDRVDGDGGVDRLACQHPIGESDLIVWFATELKG